MSKKNNKGFTLVELIIAMSILSIVLTLGYKVITGTNRVTTHQMKVFSDQQNANLINKYLTKDLEQVRKFTEANTTLNPYTYIINEGIDGIEQIEYEVKKTDNGKFYTVTRKTSSGSIELISNYQTSSKIPFSISLVENTENLFKVSLDGKSSSKYVFEVSSRVQNDVALVETPITPGGGSNSGGGTTPPIIQPPATTPPTIIETNNISGEVRFIYDYKANGNSGKYQENIKVQATAIEKDKDGETQKWEHAQYNSMKDNTTVNTYKIYAKIPIQDDILKVSLSTNNTNDFIGSKTDLFAPKKGNIWEVFNKKINNNKVYIYTSDGIQIESLKIDNNDVTKDITENKYNFNVTSEQENKKYVEVWLNIKSPRLSGMTNAFVSIGFGNFFIQTQ